MRCGWGNRDEGNNYLELYFYVQNHPFSLSLLTQITKYARKIVKMLFMLRVNGRDYFI